MLNVVSAAFNKLVEALFMTQYFTIVPTRSNTVPTKTRRSILSILVGATLCLSSMTIAADLNRNQGVKPIRIIDPAIKQREIHEAAIDTESFEIGAYSGTLAVEEFGANAVLGFTGSYHLPNRTLLQMNYTHADVGKATFEKLGEDLSFLKDSDRRFSHYNLMIGFNLFPGKSFFGTKYKFHSSIYLLAGGGMTDFAGSSKFTPVIASSYRVVLTDWLTWSIDFKDYVFKRDFLNDNKQTHNIELSSSLNLLF